MSRMSIVKAMGVCSRKIKYDAKKVKYETGPPQAPWLTCGCQAAGVITPPPQKSEAPCPEGIVFGLPGDKATVSSISLRRVAQKPHPLTYIFLLKF